MEITILLAIMLVNLNGNLGEEPEYKQPGCTTRELAHLIRIGVPDEKIEEVCSEVPVIEARKKLIRTN